MTNGDTTKMSNVIAAMRAYGIPEKSLDELKRLRDIVANDTNEKGERTDAAMRFDLLAEDLSNDIVFIP